MPPASDDTNVPAEPAEASQQDAEQLSPLELDELADKVLALIRRELVVNNERTGRYP